MMQEKMEFKHVTGILQARRKYLVTVTLRCQDQ